MVVSPIEKGVDNKWKFVIPNDNFPISKYIDFLGLELNHQNRCIISTNEDEINYVTWE